MASDRRPRPTQEPRGRDSSRSSRPRSSRPSSTRRTEDFWSEDSFTDASWPEDLRADDSWPAQSWPDIKASRPQPDDSRPAREEPDSWPARDGPDPWPRDRRLEDPWPDQGDDDSWPDAQRRPRGWEAEQRDGRDPRGAREQARSANSRDDFDPRRRGDRRLPADARPEADYRRGGQAFQDPSAARDSRAAFDPRADLAPRGPRMADPRATADPRLAPEPRPGPDPQAIMARRGGDPRDSADRQQGTPWTPTRQSRPAAGPLRAIEAPRAAAQPRRPEPLYAAEPALAALPPASELEHLADRSLPGEHGLPADRALPGDSPPAMPTTRGAPPEMPGAAVPHSPQPLLAEPPSAPDQPRRPGENTRSVHLPPPPVTAQQPLAIPVYRTSAFAFESSAQYAAVLADAAPGFSYSRIDNPTVEAFCSAVSSLEGVNLNYQVASQAFASGMAAISTVFWAFCRAGTRVIAPAAVYGGTYSFLRNVAANFGVQTDFVDINDLGQVRAAVAQGTTVVYAETLANPTVAVADIAGLARIAHEAGALLVVDSTLAPPVICRPLEHGADLVLHSATKYFGGHSDVTGGVITGHPELIKTIRRVRVDTGGSLGPDDAYLLRRGLETLPLRVRRQCSTAQMFAASLSRHPAVSAVHYPGLPDHAGHAVARRQFDAGPEGTRFGAIVTVVPFGGPEAGQAFADRLRLASVAASLGGTHTKVSHAASTTHRQMDAAALAAAGIDPASVRFSVGLEDSEDLLADAMAALDSLGRR